MPNYTITRQTESAHIYGCTDFSTVQEVGDIASVYGGATFDATVVWDIQADPGYVVDINNFEIPNTTASGIINYFGDDAITYQGAGLSSPILGAIMIQVNSTLIRVIFLLVPDSNLGFSGNAFIMPDNDINISVEIEGCADIQGEGVHLRIPQLVDEELITTGIELNDETVIGDVTFDTLEDGTIQLYGALPAMTITEREEQQDILLARYSVEISNSKYRFNYEPVLDLGCDNYYYTSSTEGYITSKGEIVGVDFDIYKKL